MFGLFGAGLMFVSVVGSALGQHYLVAKLPEKRPEPFSIKGSFDEIRDAFSERAFLIFVAGGLAAYVSQGMTFSITNYVNLFVWQFDRVELIIYPIVLFVSVVMMFFVVGPMHRDWGKPKSAVIGSITSMVLGLTPYTLFLLGFWPEPGTALSTTLVFAFLVFANLFGIVVMISGSSMIAEIVEAYEERTGRRAEGSFYAGNWFVQKCATGVGILLTGQIISAAQMPENARPGSVSFEVLSEMLLLYGGAMVVLAIVAAYWLGRFPIDRAQHEARIAALDAVARGDIDAGTSVP